MWTVHSSTTPSPSAKLHEACTWIKHDSGCNLAARITASSLIASGYWMSTVDDIAHSFDSAARPHGSLWVYHSLPLVVCPEQTQICRSKDDTLCYARNASNAR